MIILRMRSESDAKDTLKKLKKMHKFTKELIDCLEDKMEDAEDDDDDYRYDDEYEDEHHEHMRRGGASRRYRRGM